MNLKKKIVLSDYNNVIFVNYYEIKLNDITLNIIFIIKQRLKYKKKE